MIGFSGSSRQLRPTACQHEAPSGTPCEFCGELAEHYAKIRDAGEKLAAMIRELGPDGLAERPAWMDDIEAKAEYAEWIAQWADESGRWAQQSADGIRGRSR